MAQGYGGPNSSQFHLVDADGFEIQLIFIRFRRAVQVHRPTLQDLVAEADLVLEQILQVVVACRLLGGFGGPGGQKAVRVRVVVEDGIFGLAPVDAGPEPSRDCFPLSFLHLPVHLLLLHHVLLLPPSASLIDTPGFQDLVDLPSPYPYPSPSPLPSSAPSSPR